MPGGVITTALRHMMAAGMGSEAIIAAVADMESHISAADPVAERRRAYDRERKQKQRLSGGNPVESADIADITPLSPPSPKDPQTPKEPQPPHTPPRDISRARGPIFVCPENVEPQHWADFLANRKRKSLANTETAYAGQLSLIAKFSTGEWPPGRLVQIAAEKGWGTIVNPRENGYHNGRKHEEPSGPGITERAAARVIDEIRAAQAGTGYR